MKANQDKADPKSTDKKVENTVFEDDFFEKGHFWLKLRTIVLTIIAWLGVIIPIYWTVTSTLLRNHKNVKPVWNYQEGIDTFYFLLKVFFLFFVGATIFTVIMTLRSNRQIKDRYSQEFTYDFDAMLKKRRALDKFYTARFGPTTVRTVTKTYVVPAEKNITKEELNDVLKKEETDENRSNR